MDYCAKGEFDVRLVPQVLSVEAVGSGIGRMALDKDFRGDMVGHSCGEMLAFRSQAPGSAGYVAIETAHVTLQGRRGSFVLQHSSTMTRGEARQQITVIPDSGTGELEGLTGQLTITISNNRHFYQFDYSLSRE